MKALKSMQRAQELLEQGFESKASQQRAYYQVRNAYDDVMQVFRNEILNAPKESKTEDMEACYWSLPKCHHFNEKHEAMLIKVFPHRIEVLDFLRQIIALRDTIKATSINTKKDPKVIAVEKIIKQTKAKGHTIDLSLFDSMMQTLSESFKLFWRAAIIFSERTIVFL